MYKTNDIKSLFEERMNYFQGKKKANDSFDSKIKTLKKSVCELEKSKSVKAANNDLDTAQTKLVKKKQEIADLVLEKEMFNSGKSEQEFILSVSGILQKYLLLENKERLSESELYIVNRKKRELAEEYLIATDPGYIRTSVTYPEVIRCMGCDGELYLECGFSICRECGACYNDVHEATDLSYKQLQEMDTSPQFTYDKRTHLQDWLRRFQAKENKEVPGLILDKIILEAHKERIHDLGKLTEQKVKKYLKKLNENEYYDNVIAIINRINNRQPFTLSKEIEDKIMEMFQQIQEPFQKYKKKSRKNMLSYSYLINKFFLILGLPEFSKYFFLLKSPEKLREQDETFKKIVDHLAPIDKSVSWKFYPSL